ncbi:hypothetical protein AAON49_11085 [Pseudotenacibaculum sp. MALMAid0570]|uniref:hypothetical protein n=1 Tax=Pseudotenacibaculum sp. MALMAid0570 TaxID=3143938 RepID=UPI0032DFEFBD
MYYKSVRLIILRTNIKSKKNLKKVKSLLDNHPMIFNWSVDLEDIDNVLRAEVSSDMSIANVNDIIRKKGFYCEDLPGVISF